MVFGAPMSIPSLPFLGLSRIRRPKNAGVFGATGSVGKPKKGSQTGDLKIVQVLLHFGDVFAHVVAIDKGMMGLHVEWQEDFSIPLIIFSPR